MRKLLSYSDSTVHNRQTDPELLSLNTNLQRHSMNNTSGKEGLCDFRIRKERLCDFRTCKGRKEGLYEGRII